MNYKQHNVYIEYRPDHYVGPRVMVTISVRRSERDTSWVEALQHRLALEINVLNNTEFKGDFKKQPLTDEQILTDSTGMTKDERDNLG